VPKSKGHSIKAIRTSDDIAFSFQYGGKRIRVTRSMKSFLSYLKNGEEVESNLGAGARPMTFREFANDHYLPLRAKPRLSNMRSYLPEADHVRTLCEKLGDRFLHEIRSRDSEDCRKDWLGDKYVNSTIKKRLYCLRRIMDYASSIELVKRNPIPPIEDLPVGDRSSIWLSLAQIEALLTACDPRIVNLVEYMILTGARISEALDFRLGDIRAGKLYVPTEKQRAPMRERMRDFDISSLGPRFSTLIERLKPHSKTGVYFFANPNSAGHLSVAYANRLFIKAREAAGLPDIHQHDLRGTFAMHRSMVEGRNFRQLQAELGHGSPRSAQSYLDRARSFDPKESIFFNPSPPTEPDDAGQ
jgi:integrase